MVCWLDSGVEEAGQPKCLTEYQCDGTRPVCQRCSLRGTVCVFSETVDAHHTFLQKRRYSMLVERSDHEHQVLELLRTSHRTNAIRILERLRAGDDAHSVVDFAHDLTSARPASGETPGGTLRVDHGSADYSSAPIVNDTSPSNSREMLSSEPNLESLEEAQQQEEVSVANVREISLPSFQTLLFHTTWKKST